MDRVVASESKPFRERPGIMNKLRSHLNDVELFVQ